MAGLGDRAARDEDGQTYFVPKDMKFTEWKKKFMSIVFENVSKNL